MGYKMYYNVIVPYLKTRRFNVDESVLIHVLFDKYEPITDRELAILIDKDERREWFYKMINDEMVQRGLIKNVRVPNSVQTSRLLSWSDYSRYNNIK